MTQNEWTRFRILSASNLYTMYTAIEGEAPWETSNFKVESGLRVGAPDQGRQLPPGRDPAPLRIRRILN